MIDVNERNIRELEIEIKKCKKCRLWQSRTNAVPGEGDYKAKIMFVGEAPGFHEDRQGRPFVGAAGKLLTQLIESIGLKRESVYITNVVKCRPPNNRDPQEDEIETCTPYLLEQIKLIKPDIIVALGRHSANFFYKLKGESFKGITSERGKVSEIEIDNRKLQLLPTYHPAAALYNPRLREYLEKDFTKLKELLESTKEEKPKTLIDFLK